MDEFYKNLKLCNVGIDIQNYLNPNLVTNVELEELFAKRGYNGQKPKPNDELTIANCVALLKLYEVVYALTMGSIQQSSYKVGWPNPRGTKLIGIKYAYDYIQLQVKKAHAPFSYLCKHCQPISLQVYQLIVRFDL